MLRTILRRAALLLAPLALFFVALNPASAANNYYPASPFRTPIAAGANYVEESRISTFRQSMTQYGAPVYRVAAGTVLPLVTVTNIYGRVEQWPLPAFVQPASGSDGHLVVINEETGFIYEFFRANWTSASTLECSTMVNYPIGGTGISTDQRRTTAAGISAANGMVMREDFWNGSAFDPALPIQHALAMILPFSMVAPNGFVAPAVGGESGGRDTSLNRVPMGAHFALPPGLDVDSLSVHPFTRALLRAARDYGMYVTDASGEGTYNGGNIARLRVEPGLLQAMFGVPDDDMMALIQEEVFQVIRVSGIFRVDGLGAGGELAPRTCTELQDPTIVVPAGLYCLLLMRSGEQLNFPGAVPPGLIEAGVLIAVEVIYYDAPGFAAREFPNSAPQDICLAGEGRFIYMDARQAPRQIQELAANHDGGYTCAWIPAPGTVILIADGD